MVLLEALMGRPPPFHVSSFQGPSLQLALFWSLACPPTVPSQTAAVPTKAVITEGLARRSALAAGTCLGKCGLATPPPPPHGSLGQLLGGAGPCPPTRAVGWRVQGSREPFTRPRLTASPQVTFVSPPFLLQISWKSKRKTSEVRRCHR